MKSVSHWMQKRGFGNPLDRQPSEFIQKCKESRRHSDLVLAERWNPSASDSIIPTLSHAFWEQLREELKSIIDALCEIDFIGSITTFGEEIVRVSLSDDRLEGISTRTDLVLDGERIRGSVLNGGIYYLNFVITSEHKIVVQDIQKDRGPMDARKAAEHVIDRMLNIIGWTSS